MKLAFSTLGCPDWDLDTIINKAAGYGFDGLEIRGLKRELDVTKLSEFTTQSHETKQKLIDNSIKIICFSSSIQMSSSNSENDQKFFEELKRYSELCNTFNVPFIRIFGGEIGDMGWNEAIEKAGSTLIRMANVLNGVNTKIVIETHDDWMSCEHFEALMEDFPCTDSVGILWDVNHPFMFIGEDPAETWNKLGKWIYHTHWKDSKIALDTVQGFEPCLMGEGDLPHQQIFDILKNGGYNGYLSLEWEKMWHPELPNPEIAFPQYVEYMKNIMKG